MAAQKIESPKIFTALPALVSPPVANPTAAPIPVSFAKSVHDNQGSIIDLISPERPAEVRQAPATVPTPGTAQHIKPIAVIKTEVIILQKLL